MPDDALDQPPRPVTQFIQQQRRGEMHDEFSSLLADVVSAVTEHGKVGSVTLTVKIKPAGAGRVEIFDTLKSVKPEGAKAASIFFTLADGSLSRTDPHQTRLPLTGAAKGVED